MSVPTDSLQHANMLESCLGAVPLGTRPRARGKLSRASALEGGFLPLRSVGPVSVRVRTQEDVLRLVRLTQSQNLRLESPGWMLSGPAPENQQPAAVLIDLGRLDRICGLRDDGVSAEAGTVLSQIERLCRRQARTLGKKLAALRTPAGSLAAQIVDFTIQGRPHPQARQLKSVKMIPLCANPEIQVCSSGEFCDWLSHRGNRALVLEVELALFPMAGEPDAVAAQVGQSTLV